MGRTKLGSLQAWVDGSQETAFKHAVVSVTLPTYTLHSDVQDQRDGLLIILMLSAMLTIYFFPQDCHEMTIDMSPNHTEEDPRLSPLITI